jgi:hypothetical protein
MPDLFDLFLVGLGLGLLGVMLFYAVFKLWMEP